MTRRKPPKKTETLEVRLPHSVKRIFMARARSRGRTASSLVREFIDSYLADTDPKSENRRMLKRFATPAAVTSFVAGAIALHAVVPVAATAAPDLKSLFDQLDADGNGQLSAEEFVVRDSDSLHASLEAADLGKMMSLMFMHHAGADRTPHGPLPPEALGMMEHAFSHQDSDGNGIVSYGEFESAHLGALRQTFDMMDADHDGGIGADEYDRMMGHLPEATATHVVPFAEVDADRDGSISWNEFLG